MSIGVDHQFTVSPGVSYPGHLVGVASEASLDSSFSSPNLPEIVNLVKKIKYLDLSIIKNRSDVEFYKNLIVKVKNSSDKGSRRNLRYLETLRIVFQGTERILETDELNAKKLIKWLEKIVGCRMENYLSEEANLKKMVDPLYPYSVVSESMYDLD